MAGSSKLFISHSSQDDDLVRRLRLALAEQGQDVWIDSRELRGGDPLWAEISAAIEQAAAFAVIVSAHGLQSKWVGKELQHALAVQTRHGGRAAFPVIPLAMDGCKLGVLESFFDDEPIYTPLSSAAGGLDEALHAILVALGKRLPTDLPTMPQPPPAPMEELVLELGRLSIHEADGKRRARGSARLVYEPADPERREVRSARSWTFEAPLGPIEEEELRWYLETYAVWPSRFDDARVKAIEGKLVTWGHLLYAAALPDEHVAPVLQAWAAVGSGPAARRFSIQVDPELDVGAPQAAVDAAREASTLLLGLPWELLHDGRGYLFQGSQPVRVRRRLPNTHATVKPVLATPIRVLLLSPRPEDEACGFIDHRASALPLVQAIEALGEVVHLTLLAPPTLPALRAELHRAREARRPYHVLHFDGHGVYDRRVGLGGLCFEHPEDAERLGQRRHQTIHTGELGPLLRDHGIALVFLEACQTAQAGQASESVASEMLKTGVDSVVAMSHSVLVESARRFVTTFYRALAQGARVGDAMLAGQSDLKDNRSRGQVFGEGELALDDWFVPVLFQDKADPQLFRVTPARQTVEDRLKALHNRMGALPPEPATGFVGRSRELLALERLLRLCRFAVLRGQGGEGKTATAAEFARWCVRSRQVRRAAFVSVETHSHAQAVLDALGGQLVPDYSAATFTSLDDACLPIERALREQPTLIVFDNLESVLPPPKLAGPLVDPLADLAREACDSILALAQRLGAVADTRLVFTSREQLPAPFDAPRALIEMERLSVTDAVKLVERALQAEDSTQDMITGSAGAVTLGDCSAEAIRSLVDAVHGHARTLSLLAPTLRSRGVAATRAELAALMSRMEREHPGNRESSLYASVELSLRRLPPAMREQVQVLAVFHGAVDLDMLRAMMDWERNDVQDLGHALVATGLATAEPYNHLNLNPALCPYLRSQADDEQMAEWQSGWMDSMRQYATFMVTQKIKHIQMAATLTLLEMPNLLALLGEVERAGDAEATISLCTDLHSLLQELGRPRLLQRVANARNAALAVLGDGAPSHARFQAERTHIELQLAQGFFREALAGAQALLEQSRSAGETGYEGADYDLAGACWQLARVLKTIGAAESALPLLNEARQRFEAIEVAEPGRGAAAMSLASITEIGDCLRDLGRYDEAAVAYEASNARASALDHPRQVAVGKGQLGTVRLLQRRYADALEAYEEARKTFEALSEPSTVATVWHQIGMAHQEAGSPQAAEAAYRRSLALAVQLDDVAGQASTLNQLGNLYNLIDRREDAAAFYRQAADRYGALGDAVKEGFTRSNLAATLRELGRLDEARMEIERALTCKQAYGQGAEPWKTWSILHAIETDAGRSVEARQAWQKAAAAYLAYRRDGGENLDADGKLCNDLCKGVQAGDAVGAQAFLRQLGAASDLPAWLKPLIPVLQAIVAGNRDPALVEAHQFQYDTAAELLWLMERLGPDSARAEVMAEHSQATKQQMAASERQPGVLKRIANRVFGR